jgi:hypothetical protein
MSPLSIAVIATLALATFGFALAMDFVKGTIFARIRID